jgi:hypothetical protein
MGLFSFTRAEDGKSIPAASSGLPTQTHYLIQPNGQPPIAEHAYQGNGFFGGVDVFAWLAQANAKAMNFNLEAFHPLMIRDIGITLDRGDVFEDTRNGNLLWPGKRNPIAGKSEQCFTGFDQYTHELGGTPNDLIDKGILVPKPAREALNLPYPIKLSAYRAAVYEDLPASGDCPYQGHSFPADDPEAFREVTGFNVDQVFPEIDPALKRSLEDERRMNGEFDNYDEDDLDDDRPSGPSPG